MTSKVFTSYHKHVVLPTVMHKTQDGYSILVPQTPILFRNGESHHEVRAYLLRKAMGVNCPKASKTAP